MQTALRIIHAPQQRDPLVAMAARLWPDNPNLQLRWLRAVAMVRRTKRGWLLDKPQPRTPQQ